MGKEFSFDARVLMCQNCGAPLETGFTGGEVTCGYCGTVNVFTPRKEEPIEPNSVMLPIEESERMALLRRQDGSQPSIPPSISQLLAGGKLAPWKEGEALAMWRTTCSELAGATDFSSAELLYFLTMILSNHYSEKNDTLRQRALYESALEVLALPRHRQLIRGMLARNAALSGELEAAEKWLEPCNPRSSDLESDSSYRVSRAEILTMREDWSGVLQILGQSIGDVPITSALDGKAIVQRANALERTGRTDAAAEQLSLFIQANGALGRNGLKMIAGVYGNAGVEVCPESLKKALNLSSMRTGSRQAAIENPGGCFGQVFAASGVLLLVSSVAFPSFIGSRTGSTVAGPGIAVGVMGIIFLVIGIRHIRAGNRIKRLFKSGIQARGIVKSVSPTGWKINKVPQYAMEMEITISGQTPYTATVKKTIPNAAKDRFRPGAEVEVSVDPADRNHFTVLD